MKLSPQAQKNQSSSPLIRVKEAAESLLDEWPNATYEKISRGIFPPGVLVRLGPRSYRFHRENLIRWLSEGGGAGEARCTDA